MFKCMPVLLGFGNVYMISYSVTTFNNQLQLLTQFNKCKDAKKIFSNFRRFVFYVIKLLVS